MTPRQTKGTQGSTNTPSGVTGSNGEVSNQHPCKRQAHGPNGSQSPHPEEIPEEPAPSPLDLVLDEVSHRYPLMERDALPQISMEIGAGERVLLVGPNGSGKTTLFLRIVGLLMGPGRITVGGMAVEPAALGSIRRKVGYLWQNPDDALLLPTVAEDVAFGPFNDGMGEATARAVSDLWIRRLAITHLAGRSIYHLSLGEKQLVALAGVLARSPGVLLLDEPTSALDAEARTALLDRLDQVGATQVVATHEPEQWTRRSRECRLIRLPRIPPPTVIPP